MAESSLVNNWNSFFENWATNGSMLYTDTTNWDVLAYVWSLDYFNNDIQGQNDMVRNPRQSGSSIKPLIYALWFEKLPLTLDTPIYDIEFKAGKDTPHNADGAFEWPIPLKKALWFSRNIPAVKLFLALGWEEVAKPFLQSLWLEWIKDNIEYWYPLALGAWEVSMLQMAEAYSNLSRENPAKINPILEIKNNNWEILYKKEVEEKDNIIPPWIITLMWKILADPSNRIGAWSTKFNVKGLTYALKTWTSNVVTDKWSRPRDWWLAAYTPSRVILMWAGNADASAMNRNAYWGTIHANSIKAFLSSLLENNYISNEEMPVRDVVGLKISKISGKLPSENTPAELIIDTMGYNWHVPSTTEWPISELEIDISCYWKISPLTPTDQIRKWYLIEASTFMPGNNDLEDIKKYHREQAMSWWNSNLFVEEPTNYCEEREPLTNDNIEITFIRPQNKQSFAKKNNVVYSIKSPIPIKKINITLDGNNIKSFIDNSTEIYGSKEIDLSNYENWSHTLWITAIDNNNATKTSTTPINLVSEDTDIPYFNKESSTIIKNEDWSYNVTLLFDDNISWVKNWVITDTNGWSLNKFNWQATNFTTKNQIIKAMVEDFYWNKLEQEINLAEF
jgi:membrane carboxypeptidase/penicillin-binding protein PbpC